MKKIAILIVISVILFSCKNNTDHAQFKLVGELKNIPDQKIYLEQLYFSKKDPEVLDTAEIKNGHFELSAIAQEEGLFRLRLEKLEHGFLFINDKPLVNFKADINDVSLEGPVFNTPVNDQLKKFLVSISAQNKLIVDATANIDRLKSTAGNDSLLAVENKKINKLGEGFNDFIVQYIDTTRDPILAMFATGYTRNVDAAKLKQIVPNLSKRFPKHQEVASLVQQFNQFIAQQNQPKPVQTNIPSVGTIAPEFTMNDVNEKAVSLNSYKGKYVLVDFWASWCAPCRAENPNVVAAYNKFKDKNFTVLGISLDDDKAAWLKAIQDDHINWIQVSELKGMNSPVASLYGVETIPYNVLIDPQGKIIATSLRGDDLDKKLSEVLK